MIQPKPQAIEAYSKPPHGLKEEQRKRGEVSARRTPGAITLGFVQKTSPTMSAQRVLKMAHATSPVTHALRAARGCLATTRPRLSEAYGAAKYPG